jgi:4-amino-4-deoxy-L-arabinose transferase-like glycosyltransferase
VERALTVLGAIGVAVVYLLGIAEPLSNYDEPIFAEFMRAMERSGDVFTLTYQGAETLQRPPTAVALYTLLALVVPGEAGLRLGPVLFTLLSALGAGFVVARLFRDRWAGLLAAGVCAGVPSVFLYGRLLLNDPPFVFAIVVAVAATIASQREARYVVWAAAALGAGFAFKSFAAAVPLVTLAPWLLVAWRRHGRSARPARAVVAFVALAVPYFVVGSIAHGGRFWRDHIATMLIDRASGDLESVIGIGGPGAYLRHLWLADGPLIALLLLGGVVGAGVYAVMRRDRELGVAVTAAAGTLILLTAISTRLAHYMLLFYPLAAICLGGLFARGGPRFGRYTRPLRALAATVSISVFALCIAGEPFDATAMPSWASRELGQTFADETGPEERLYVYNWYAPAVGYYADRPFTMLSSVPEIADAIGNSDPFLQAGNVAAVPPWPGGVFWLAGPDVAEGFPPPGLEVVRWVAGSRGYKLAQVQAAQ